MNICLSQNLVLKQDSIQMQLIPCAMWYPTVDGKSLKAVIPLKLTIRCVRQHVKKLGYEILDLPWVYIEHLFQNAVIADGPPDDLEEYSNLLGFISKISFLNEPKHVNLDEINQMAIDYPCTSLNFLIPIDLKFKLRTYKSIFFNENCFHVQHTEKVGTRIYRCSTGNPQDTPPAVCFEYGGIIEPDEHRMFYYSDHV